MAFPTTISNLALPSDTASKAGPFIWNNNVFIIGEDTGTADLEIWKATDPTTSFSLSAVLLASGGESFPKMGCWAAIQENGVLHIIAQENSTTTNDYRVHYIQFDLDGESVNETQVIYTPASAPTAGMASVDICINMQNRRLFMVYNGESNTVYHTATDVTAPESQTDFAAAVQITANGRNPGVSFWERDDDSSSEQSDMMVCYSQGGNLAGRLIEWTGTSTAAPNMYTERVADFLGNCDGINSGICPGVERPHSNGIQEENWWFDGWDDSVEEKLHYYCPFLFSDFGLDWSDNVVSYKASSANLTAGVAERTATLATDYGHPNGPVYNAVAQGTGDEMRWDAGVDVAQDNLNTLLESDWTTGNHTDTAGAQGAIIHRGDNLVYAWLTDDSANNDLLYQEYVIRSAPRMTVIEETANTGNAGVAEVYTFNETLLENDVVIVCQYKDIGSYPQPTGYTLIIGPESNSPNTMVSYKRMGSTPDTNFTIATGFGAAYAYTVQVVRGVSTERVLNGAVPARSTGNSTSGVINVAGQEVRGDWPMLLWCAGMDENGLFGMDYFPMLTEGGVIAATGGNPNGARGAACHITSAALGEKFLKLNWGKFSETADANRGFLLQLRNAAFVGQFPTPVATPIPPVQFGNIGPFVSSTGNVYTFGVVASSQVRAARSDETNVYFETVDTELTFGTIQAMACVQEGDLIHVACHCLTNGRAQYLRFNMANNTFSDLNSLNLPTNSPPESYHIDIDIRSDGDLIVVYPGENNGVQELAYSRRESGVWTNGIVFYTGAAGEHGIAPTVLVGQGDQAHISYWVETDATTEVRFRALSSANVLRTERIKTTTAMDRTRLGKALHNRGSTDYITFAVEQGGSYRQHRFVDFSDDTDLSLVVDEIEGVSAVNNPQKQTAHIVDSTASRQPKYHIVNPTGSVLLALRSDDGFDGNFGEVVSNILTSTPSQIDGFSAELIIRGNQVIIAVAYSDGGSTNYDEYVIRLIGELFQADNVALTTGGITMGGAGSALPIEKMLPDGDDFIGSWTNELLSTTDIYLSIDEDSPKDDNDYARSSTNPIADRYKVSLSNLVGDFRVAQPHRVKYGYRKNGLPTIDCTVRLIEGASTVIASWQHLDVDTVVVEANQLLTQEQVNSITNYDNLFLEFQADVPIADIENRTLLQWENIGQAVAVGASRTGIDAYHPELAWSEDNPGTGQWQADESVLPYTGQNYTASMVNNTNNLTTGIKLDDAVPSRLDLGSATDYTVEFYVYHDGTQSNNTIFSYYGPNTNYYFNINSTERIQFIRWSGSFDVTATPTAVIGSWVHYAVCVTGSTNLQIWVNGTRVVNTTMAAMNAAGPYDFSIGGLAIGSPPSAYTQSFDIAGSNRIGPIHIWKGFAKYDGATITPDFPNAP